VEDTDGDGLIEADEDGYGTSDLRFDSDLDGVGDAYELREGTSPTNPAVWPQVAILGWGDAADRVQAVPTGEGFIGLATGEEHSLALRSDGVVMAWGGLGTFGQNQPPPGLSDVVEVSAGGDNWIEDTAYSVAVRNDGSVVFWGFDSDGRLLPPAGLSGVSAVSAGRTHCLALKSDGTVVEWGSCRMRDRQCRPDWAMWWPSPREGFTAWRCGWMARWSPGVAVLMEKNGVR
jgi:alpha-tubulin suppressor-like RCC1 family protein